MLKPYQDPYGYKKLLAYKKAEELQMACSHLTRLFPFSKTLSSLADQMDRSARSGKQNIVEGWRRNTTREYYDFLGFSIGAVAELEEDCDDIIRGAYPEIMDKMGLKKDKPLSPISPHWNIGEVEKLRFYPLDSSLPLIIQLKLRCKELNFILKKLQDSLLEKMKNENTLSLGDKAQIIKRNKSEAEILEIKLMEESGLIRLEDGKFIPKEVYDRINGVAN